MYYLFLYLSEAWRLTKVSLREDFYKKSYSFQNSIWKYSCAFFMHMNTAVYNVQVAYP